MKHLLLIAMIILLASCSQSEDQKAQPLLSQIESLYAKGEYRQTLDSIVSLRTHYPKAIESRRRALEIWRDASLKMAQDDVAKTDVQLQNTIAQLQTATSIGERNRLAVRRDSLQARYDAMCGVVKMIHMRQKKAE